MTEVFKFDVTGVQDTTTALDDVAGKINTVLSTLKAAVPGYDGCWGNDEYGKPFADGPNGNDGYVARDPHLITTLEGKVKRLNDYGNALRDVVKTVKQTEANNVTDVKVT